MGDIHGNRAAIDLSFDHVHEIALQLDKDVKAVPHARELTGAMEHGMVRRRIPVDHNDPAGRVYLLLKSDRSVKMTSKVARAI